MRYAVQDEGRAKEAKRYAVFDNNKPASKIGFPLLLSDCWNSNEFETFAEALVYAKNWVDGFGDTLPPDFAPDTKYDYDGHGDTIEIRTL